MADWYPIKTAPAEEVVMTKIHDDDGERNVRQLKRKGRLWYFPDESMYVYYVPTHWRREGSEKVTTMDVLCGIFAERWLQSRGFPIGRFDPNVKSLGLALQQTVNDWFEEHPHPYTFKDDANG